MLVVMKISVGFNRLRLLARHRFNPWLAVTVGDESENRCKKSRCCRE